MAKQYNSLKREFDQAAFDRVSPFLTERLKSAFLVGSIDEKWCLTYCIPYISCLTSAGEYEKVYCSNIGGKKKKEKNQS